MNLFKNLKRWTPFLSAPADEATAVKAGPAPNGLLLTTHPVTPMGWSFDFLWQFCSQPGLHVYFALTDPSVSLYALTSRFIWSGTGFKRTDAHFKSKHGTWSFALLFELVGLLAAAHILQGDDIAHQAVADRRL